MTTEGAGKVGNCLMITATAGGSAGCYQDVAVVAEKIYLFSAYVKAGTEATYSVIVYDLINLGGIFLPGAQEEIAGDWSTHIEHLFEAPAGCTSVRIIIKQTASGVGTTIYFDEIALYNVFTVGSDLHMATGLTLD